MQRSAASGEAEMALLTLPDECIGRILSQLDDPKDVLVFQSCSKKCKDLGRDFDAWSKRLRKKFGLSLKVRSRPDLYFSNKSSSCPWATFCWSIYFKKNCKLGVPIDPLITALSVSILYAAHRRVWP